MALSANTNVTLPVVGTPVVLFDSNVDGNSCCTFCVFNRTTSTEYAFVNVVGLHPVGYWAPIAPGETILFRYGKASDAAGITLITGYSAAGTAAVDTKIVSKL